MLTVIPMVGMSSKKTFVQLGFAKIASDTSRPTLRGINVKGRDHIHVRWFVGADFPVHESYRIFAFFIPVVVNPLN